jgi:site-specific recombinase XerD
MLTVKGRFGMIHPVARTSRSDRALLQAVVAAWLDHYPSPHTRAAYRTDLDHFGRWTETRRVDPFALDENELREYRAACEAEGAGPSTVARRLSALASFVNFAAERGNADAAPQIDRPALPASSTTGSLSDGDATALLAAADQMDPRSALLMRLLMLDGLKVGEAVRADVPDVAGRPPRMTLTLHAAGPRVIKLHPDTARLLAAYLGSRRRGPLLLSGHRASVTKRLTRFGVDYVIKQAAEAAGLARTVSANTLRRRFVMDAHERGEDLEHIRDRAGHANARTTRRYLDTDEDTRSDPPAHSEA